MMQRDSFWDNTTGKRATSVVATTAVLLAALILSPACSDKKKKKTTPKAGARKSPRGGGESLPSGSKSPEKDDKGKARPTARGGDAGSGDDGSGNTGDEPGTRPAAARGGDDGSSKKPGSRPAPRPREDPRVVIRRNIKKANDALREGKNDRAIAMAKSALALDEKNVDAIVIVAKAYFRKNELELCRAVLSFLAAVDSDNATGYYLAGHLALKDGEKRRARIFFEKAVEKSPKLSSAWSMLCTWYVQGKNWKESDPQKAGKDANTACAKAAKLRSWSYKDRLNLGNVYRGLGNRCRSQGMGACEAQKARCVKASPQNTGPCESAFQNCKKGVGSRCKSVEALYYKKAKEAYTRANTLYQKLLRKKGKSAKPYPNALYNLGVLYLDAKVFPGETGMSRLKKAKAYLNQYLRSADPRAIRKERKAVKELIQRADNLYQVEKAKEQARKAQEAAKRSRPRGG